MNKKGQGLGLGMLITVVIIFLIVGLAAIFSLDIIEDTEKDFCTSDGHNYVGNTCLGCENAVYPYFNSSDNKCYNSTSGVGSTSVVSIIAGKASTNATGDVVLGISKVPEKMPTLGNVAIAAIIIGVLLAAFGGFMAYKKFNG